MSETQQAPKSALMARAEYIEREQFMLDWNGTKIQDSRKDLVKAAKQAAERYTEMAERLEALAETNPTYVPEDPSGWSSTRNIGKAIVQFEADLKAHYEATKRLAALKELIGLSPAEQALVVVERKQAKLLEANTALQNAKGKKREAARADHARAEQELAEAHSAWQMLEQGGTSAVPPLETAEEYAAAIAAEDAADAAAGIRW